MPIRDRLHFAAHSHAYWPDVTRDAQIAALGRCRAAGRREMDARAGRGLAGGRARHRAASARCPIRRRSCRAANTHEFVNRLLSALPLDRAPKIVTTDGEFHSFKRQTERLAEDGLIEIVAVPTEPFASLPQRIVDAVKAHAPDMVFVSQVFFNSGYALPDLDALVDAVAAPDRLVVIDGYHAFLALPVDLLAVADRAFYLAGGYKYAMAGEGACFMHCPPGFAPRPRNTGWYASFANLSGPQDEVGYATDGHALHGRDLRSERALSHARGAATGWRRMVSMPTKIHAHVMALQEIFLARACRSRPIGLFDPARLVVPRSEMSRGNFLTFDHPDAAAWQARLKRKQHRGRCARHAAAGRLRAVPQCGRCRAAAASGCASFDA